MWWAVKQLSVPINYLRIKHGDGLFHSKKAYDFVIPIILTLVTMAVFALLDIDLAIFDKQELPKRLIDLLVLMIVFYMAALAAVATFDRDGIDDKLKDESATLSVRKVNDDGYEEKSLTYRQFISYLFGYLSFLSLCLYVFIVFMSIVWPEVERKLLHVDWPYSMIVSFSNPAIFLVVFFAVWQLIITSLLGIYFLTERIQTLNNPKA